MGHKFTIYRVETNWITHEQTATKVPGFTRQGPKGYYRLMLDADRMHRESGIYTHFEVRRHDTGEGYSTRRNGL